MDTISTMKPIQATPKLSGNDALKLLTQVNRKPTEQANKKNSMLHGVLNNIRK